MPASDPFARLTRYARPALPLAVLTAAGVLGALRGPGGAILALAAGALLAVIALLWRSLQLLVGDAELPVDEALGFDAVTADDAQKRVILRALKDLEYERGLGKIGDDDYRELAARYRAEAKAVLRDLDTTRAPARARAEALVEAHLRGTPDSPVLKKKRKTGNREQGTGNSPDAGDREQGTGNRPEQGAQREVASTTTTRGRAAVRAGTAAGTGTAEAGGSAADAREEAAGAFGADGASTSGDAWRARVVCTECAADNEPDAVFCKKCGARVGVSAGGAT